MLKWCSFVRVSSVLSVALALSVCIFALRTASTQITAEGKIGFESNRGGQVEINVMDAEGGKEQRLTNNSALDEYPAISHDGQKIAFQSDRDGNEEIYKMRLDGAEQTRITVNDASDQFPKWGK